MNIERPTREHISEDAIRAVWRAYGLGEIGALRPASSGSRNVSYIVDDALAVRFNTQDTGIPKFSNERAAYDLLARQTTLPVPRVVALDETRRIVPYDFIIVTRLPGSNLAESWRDLTPEQIHDIAHAAGRSLAVLHQQTFEGFGKLRDLERQPFPSWHAYFSDYGRRYLLAAQRHHLLDAPTHEWLEQIIDRSEKLFASVTRGSLIHSDYHYENVLQQGGQLSGILDFEWAFAGDPSYDFVTAHVREEQVPGSEEAFVAGYTSLRTFDPQHERKLPLYHLFLHLENATWHAEQADAPAAEKALAQMRALLDNPVLQIMGQKAPRLQPGDEWPSCLAGFTSIRQNR
jgi:aminoglycoside phosphotransferase (APT) family kinase protein